MSQILESARRGRFGYEEIKPNLIIPFTYREDRQYCATSVLVSHFEKENIGLPENLVAFEYLKGYPMMADEIVLWDEINNIHNDDVYKIEFVYGNESIVNMVDVRAIFKYMDDCKERLAHGLTKKIDCGIARIWMKMTKTEILLPFVVEDGQRYVPVDISHVPKTLNITKLTDIHVMYLRFVFHVLKMELASTGYDVNCVLLDEVVAHWKKQANGDFEYTDDFWPSVQSSDIDGNKENNNDTMNLTTNKAKDVMKEKTKEEPKEGPKSEPKDKPKVEPKPKRSAPKAKEVDPEPKQADPNPKQADPKPNQADPKPKHAESKSEPKKPTASEFKRKQTNTQSKSKTKKTKNAKAEEDQVYYFVECLLGYKKVKGKEMVLVHWKGYGSDVDSWEPVESLTEGLMEDVENLRATWKSQNRK